MKYIVALVLLVVCTFARADLVMHNNTKSASMRLQQTTCSNAETMAILKPEWRAKFKNMRIETNDGVVRMFGCWFQEDDAIVVILQDGTPMRIPVESFQEATI